MIGSTFYLEATVSNAGQAALDPSPTPEVTIILPSGAGYTLTGAATRSFTVGVPVIWEITAPGQPSVTPDVSHHRARVVCPSFRVLPVLVR